MSSLQPSCTLPTGMIHLLLSGQFAWRYRKSFNHFLRCWRCTTLLDGHSFDYLLNFFAVSDASDQVVWHFHRQAERCLKCLHYAEDLLVLVAVADHLQVYWHAVRSLRAFVECVAPVVVVVVVEIFLLGLDSGDWKRTAWET